MTRIIVPRRHCTYDTSIDRSGGKITVLKNFTGVSEEVHGWLNSTAPNSEIVVLNEHGQDVAIDFEKESDAFAFKVRWA